LCEGASGQAIAECRDTEIGRKYAVQLDSGAGCAARTWASGYHDSGRQWSYVKNAFDKWLELAVQRLAALCEKNRSQCQEKLT
jgi:hypothetical protein